VDKDDIKPGIKATKKIGWEVEVTITIFKYAIDILLENG